MLSWLWARIQALLATIRTFVVGVAGFIFQSFTHYDEIVGDIRHIVDQWRVGRANLAHEIQALKDFRFDPKWKSRVINVPIAIDQTRDLISSLADGFRDKIDLLVEPFHELSLILHEEAAPDVGDPQGAINAMSRATVKLGHVVTMLHQVRDAVDQVIEFENQFIELRQTLESLEVFFLQQGNRRQWTDEHLRKRIRIDE